MDTAVITLLVITLQLKFVKGKIFYINNNTYKVINERTIIPQKIVEQNELQITLIKMLKFMSLKTIIEPKNIEDKFAIAITINNCLVGYLPKEKHRKIAQDCSLLFTSL